MPAHHPVSAASASLFLRPRQERERLVTELCDRLSDGLDADVATLRDLMKERQSRPEEGRAGRRSARFEH
jgi:hypothetical protein